MKDAPSPSQSPTAQWKASERPLADFGGSDPPREQPHSEIKADELLDRFFIADLDKGPDANAFAPKVGFDERMGFT